MVFHSFSKYILAISVVSAPLALIADEKVAPGQTAPAEPQKKVPTREELLSQASVDNLSKTYGHLIQRSLANPMVKLNPKAVIQGIQEGLDGKQAPLTEKEYEEALNLIQQYAYEDMANKNLQEAEALLKKNSEESGVVVIADGKVQYKVLKEGAGDAVTEETVPTINYEATYSNGQKLGSSEQTGGPIDVKLNDTIPGFKAGMLGMKVGEKRRIMIHPEMGFGKSGQIPNGLLVFEIEVTKLSPLPAEEDVAEDEEEDDDDDLSDLISSDELLADDEDDYDDEDDDVEEDLDALQVVEKK